MAPGAAWVKGGIGFSNNYARTRTTHVARGRGVDLEIQKTSNTCRPLSARQAVFLCSNGASWRNRRGVDEAIA